jgi:uncharacterized protein (DUF1778 family)
MEEKKNKRKYDEAHKRATMKYYAARARIVLTTSKENRDKIQRAATDAGQSVNQFILDKVLKSL